MVRLKHRYLLVNILYPDSKDASTKSNNKPTPEMPLTVHFRQPSSDRLDSKILLRMIRDGVAEIFGDYGSGMIAGSLQIKYFSQATSTAIIRISRDHYRLVWAALTFTTRLPKPVDQPCVMQVVRVSGTIKKAEEEAIRRARLSITRAQRAAGSVFVPPPNSEIKDIDPVTHANDLNDDDDFSGFADGIEDADEPGDVDDESD